MLIFEVPVVVADGVVVQSFLNVAASPGRMDHWIIEWVPPKCSIHVKSFQDLPNIGKEILEWDSGMQHACYFDPC